MHFRSRLSTLVALLCISQANAAPTEQRTWTATNGKTVTGSVLSIEGNKAVMKKENGDTIKVPISVFTEEDKEFLKKHFASEPEETAAAETKDSGAKPATGLPHPQGEVVGPIAANGESNYFLYIPKTLKDGRKAPLMFRTDATGGNKGALQKYAAAAELNGWIIAISVESKNGTEADRAQRNFNHSKDCVEHLYSTLPIDKERTYYTGGSGGGASAFDNSSGLPSMGVMPIVSYIPQGVTPKGQDFFIIGGCKDYNRYASANANKALGKKAVHRIYPGGHGGMPEWMAEDGFIWLQTRFLSKNYKDYSDEALDFEGRLLAYLDAAKAAQPYRVYATAKLIDEELPKSPNIGKFKKLIDELESNELNVKYYDALEDIDDLSKGEMADVTGGAKMKHSDPKVTRTAEKLLKKYTGVPVIEEVLKGLAEKTQ